MELVKAIFIGGLPIALIGFTLVYWSIKNQYISADDHTELLKEKKNQSDDKQSDFRLNPIHQKWLFFGGGYYGTMAFATYLYIEMLEVFDFFTSYTSFQHLIDQITVSAVFGLIIESFLNIIPAFIWFTYWPDLISIQNGWYWLLASYAGYHLGSHGAKLYAKQKIRTETC